MLLNRVAGVGGLAAGARPRVRPQRPTPGCARVARPRDEQVSRGRRHVHRGPQARERTGHRPHGTKKRPRVVIVPALRVAFAREALSPPFESGRPPGFGGFLLSLGRGGEPTGRARAAQRLAWPRSRNLRRTFRRWPSRGSRAASPPSGLAGSPSRRATSDSPPPPHTGARRPRRQGRARGEPWQARRAGLPR